MSSSSSCARFLMLLMASASMPMDEFGAAASSTTVPDVSQPHLMRVAAFWPRWDLETRAGTSRWADACTHVCMCVCTHTYM